MNKAEIEHELDKLYMDRELLSTLDDSQICEQFSVDYPSEAWELNEGAINDYGAMLADEYEGDDIYDVNGFKDEQDFINYKFN